MPFTPFHMGPALVLKAVAPDRFSLIVFGASQILIDLEPLVRIVRGDAVLHGFTHTIGGATLIGVLAAVLVRPLANWTFSAWLADPQRSFVAWARGPVHMSWAVALASALIGTYSHLLLDGLMHADMQPFRPFTDVNPLLHLTTVGNVYRGCVLAGVSGVGLMLGLAARELLRGTGKGR